MSSFDRSEIARIAQEEGIDPAYALAVAERESNFNPKARASVSVQGLFQMTGANRRKYGVPDNADPETQIRGFARFTHALKDEMKGVLGREPTPQELYLGHYWGGGRAARILRSGGGHAPGDVFTPQELAQNPSLGKAQNVGGLARNIMGDMNRRMSKFAGSGEPIDFAQYGGPATEISDTSVARGEAPVQFSAFGMGDDERRGRSAPTATARGPAPDFSVFGKEAGEVKPGQEIDVSNLLSASARKIQGMGTPTQPADTTGDNAAVIPPDVVTSGKGFNTHRKDGDPIDRLPYGPGSIMDIQENQPPGGFQFEARSPLTFGIAA